MKNPVLKNKSFDFGVLVVALCRQFRNEKTEFVLAKQLLRSGTAVGALVREAEYGQSRADFISKMSIALKEANETEYWLDLMKASGMLAAEKHAVHSQALKEILRMLIASIKTAKANQKNQ
jgi:four helix bundle protein